MESIGNNAAERLRSYIERIERLEAQKKELAEDIKEIMTEVKSAGFVPAILRQIIKERGMDQSKLAERDALLEIYRNALGDYVSTPLGEAAMAVVR
jgi:uncharacterized protein (UPF0335 family)